MNCMNSGAFLVDKDLDYCPKCGCNVLIQKKVDYLSRQYYNRVRLPPSLIFLAAPKKRFGI